MKAKEYLRLIREWDHEITRLEAVVAMYRDQATAITSQLGGLSSAAFSDIHDNMAETVARYVDKSKELTEAIKVKTDLRMYVVRQIEDLDEDSHRRILFLRYVENKAWKDICEDTSYSETSVYRIHQEALKAFEEKYKKILGI